MDEEGNTKEDLKLPESPENYARELKIAFEKASDEGKGLNVSVLTAMGHEQVMSHKELAGQVSMLELAKTLRDKGRGLPLWISQKSAGPFCPFLARGESSK